MADLIDAIIKTRETTAQIFAKSLVSLDGNTESEIVKKFLAEVESHNELFSEGWYSPPPKGAAVLLDTKPFKRLQYDSLRKPEYWPNETSRLEKEALESIDPRQRRSLYPAGTTAPVFAVRRQNCPTAARVSQSKSLSPILRVCVVA